MKNHILKLKITYKRKINKIFIVHSIFFEILEEIRIVKYLFSDREREKNCNENNNNFVLVMKFLIFI